MPIPDTAPKPRQTTLCYHCGTPCINRSISIEDKYFCCDGCKLVYELINEHGLCNYYELEKHPGLSGLRAAERKQFAFLDDETIAARLYRFNSEDLAIVTFYLPAVHCSSCMWLLEHLGRLREGILESRLNFSKKEVTIHFSKKKITLRQLAELLTTIGYEPYISLEDTDGKKAVKTDRKQLYQLGVAGFCFANIMMMSFPEYLGGATFEHKYALLLRALNLLLGIPVFFYSASGFFTSAWKGLKAKTLNIDAPIALAILITFSRSVYEIISGTGAGYLDSMSGIVFFMLIGRVVQERTYRSISFHRDYRSYFPVAVTVMGEQDWESRSLHQLKEGDIVKLFNNELIPADSMLLEGEAHIDYSFVTGESNPVHIRKEEWLYAGGRHMGAQLIIRIMKPVAGSYLTSLWNHTAFKKDKEAEGRAGSMIHTLSRYFTLILFSLAALTALYWAIVSPSNILNSVTAMLIVACPCALLLAATYTNGHLLRIFSNNGLFLRDPSVIEQLAKITHVVFDKTGTLTHGFELKICQDKTMTEHEKWLLYTVVQSSSHPLSRALAASLKGYSPCISDSWTEIPGKGIKASVLHTEILVGSASFLNIHPVEGANVYARIDTRVFAFSVQPGFRRSLGTVIKQLKKKLMLSVLSGDTAQQQRVLQQLFGKDVSLYFQQQPVDKLHYIERLQKGGAKVLMIGDGLNDAGALQQSNVGITLAEDVNNFTPACDAVLDAKSFSKLPGLLRMAKAGRSVIAACFLVSVIYNVIGLWFAMTGRMQPMIAAILMPASTLSIVLISTFISWLAAARLLENNDEDKGAGR